MSIPVPPSSFPNLLQKDREICCFPDTVSETSREATTTSEMHQKKTSKTCGKVAKKNSNRLNLPPNPAKHYAEQLISALNAYDVEELQRSLATLCSPTVKIVKRVYGIDDKVSLVDTEFRSIEDFCLHLAAWNEFVPDGVFEASGHRVVVNSAPTFVFISFLHFHGHSLGKFLDFLNIPFHWYHPLWHEIVATKEVHTHWAMPTHYYQLQGSLAVLVNPQGLIEGIELYLRECS